jgi:hypothetical protein
VLRIRGGREPAYLFTAQAQFLPQPLDPPDPSGEPVVPQFRLETLWSVRLPRAHMRGPGRHFQTRVLLGALRGVAWPVVAVVEGDGDHCSKFRSDEIQNGTSCTAKRR